MANGDANGNVNEDSDDNDYGGGEELTAAQKESKLRQIAREYGVPGRPSSGEILMILYTKRLCSFSPYNISHVECT